MTPARTLLVAFLLVLLGVAAGVAQDTGPGPVRVIELDGSVDPVSARFV